MRDFDDKISEWRKQMLKEGVGSVALIELENHLREEMEQQVRQGLPPQQVFEVAAKKIGQAHELKREFKKAESLEIRLVMLIGAGCVTVAGFFSLWSLPFLFVHETGWVAKIFGLAALATTVLSWKYNGKLLPVIRNHWVRAAIGFLCCIGSILWIQFFVINFLPRLLVYCVGKETRLGEFLVIFIWGWTVMAVLGGICFGLEKSARKSTVA